MSEGFNWDSEIPTEDEVIERSTKVASFEPSKRVDAISEPEYHLTEDQQASEEVDDFEFLTNARLRLEQGRLYEMFLKHNLFGEIDADPRAVANVQKELKEFIQERLEILLGLKPDPRLNKMRLEQSMPFNSMEIDILKKVIARISGGATEQQEIPKQAPKTDSLRPLGSSKPTSQIKPLTDQKQSVSMRKTTPQPSSAPQKESEKSFERPNKPISELTAAERAEWNKQISLEQKAKKAPPTKNHAPIPSFDQQVLHYGAQANRYAQNGLVGKILQSLPNKGE